MFIKIWDSQQEWKNTKTFPGHEHVVSSVRFMPGDQHIVSAGRDKTIRIFDVASTCVVARCCTTVADSPADILYEQSSVILIGSDASHHLTTGGC